MTRRPLCRLATLALMAVLLAGCGGAAAPADSAPELADRLARVDRAVATGDEGRIRERVDALLAATESARDSGSITDGQADRILAAADELLAQLPSEAPTPKPAPTSSPPSPSPDEDEEEKPPPAPHGKPEKHEKPGKAKGHKDD